MIQSIQDAIASIEEYRKTIEVYSSSPTRANKIADQFSTKNVSVTHSRLPAEAGEGFVIIRDRDDGFLGSLGLSTFSAVISPEIHPPWVLAQSETDYDAVFDFLDNTLFSSYNRKQMLATAREIEERAWRVGEGTLYTGFQRADAFRTQLEVYERLATRDQLLIQVFIDAAWETPVSDRLTVHSETADEIGSFWFVVFDGGGSELAKCALVAEERQLGTFYGFWSYDPSIVDDLIAYLESEYVNA